MSSDDNRMERVQILVSREQKHRMQHLAKQADCSVGEIYRRAADAYSFWQDVDVDDVEIHHPALEAIVEALEVSGRRASEALDRAEREVATTLSFYEERSRAWRAREKADKVADS